MGFERLEERLPFALQVSISPASIVEAGGAAAALVSRTGSLSSPLTVNLASSDATEATVPTSVVIPANASQASFTITGVDDNVIDHHVTVTITASAAGHSNGVGSIQVLNNDVVSLTSTTTSDVATLTPGSQPGQYFATVGPPIAGLPGVASYAPFGGQGVFQSLSNTTAMGDVFVPVDVTKTYGLSGWAKSGDEFGERYDAANRQSFGFASFDVDHLQILPEHVYKFSGAADTTLAAPLNPGDTTIKLASASGWSNAAGAISATRGLAWYGYTNSQGSAYPDYT